MKRSNLSKENKEKIRKIWLKADSNFVKKIVIRPNKSPQNHITDMGRENNQKQFFSQSPQAGRLAQCGNP
jgi:hypothetical protein